VKQAIGRPHVSFKVCEISMKNQQVDKSKLLPGVTIVPDGIGEIVTRQREGWGYIKAAVQ
jgi:intracellular sulfur oxidation DsrE/DsrF family protein